MNKNYYAIIPANVRYDDNLTANAKLLYGEITALCNEKGYCWASNNYFAKLYKVSKISISKWISQLKQYGYIELETQYKEGSKEIFNRYIRILYDPIKEKFNTPIKEKFKDNNTLINITMNNTDELENHASQDDKKTKINKPPKIKYLDEVYLTEAEHDSLVKNYGKSTTASFIEKLDYYIASRGLQRKYKSHYKTILAWMKKDGVQSILPPPQPDFRKYIEKEAVL